MAACRLLKIKINKGKSVARTLSERTDYAQNPDKTVNIKVPLTHEDTDVSAENPIGSIIADQAEYAANSNKTYGGALVRGYECDPRTVDEEFLLSKNEYDYLTNRNQGKRNVLAYHIRQSFKPGEISPELALEIGYELGLRFTKGKHAFVVATHTDKAHIHNHIVFNSTALCHARKFKDFWFSGLALQKLSDILCLEHGLSIIENPAPSKGKNYHKWQGNKEPSWQDKLRQKIDEVIPTCGTFEDFLAAMKKAGYAVNDKRKHITLLAPGQKKPTRLNTLGGDHTESAIRERLAGAKVISTGGTSGVHARFSLLIDIQAKIQEGKGAGYENWARIFNLKEAAKTLIFLKENGIDSYEDLKKKASSASGDFSTLTKKIKESEQHLAEISELQKQIGTYGKTREVFAAYRKSGYSENFYEEHRADITLHRAAKKYFDDLGYGKDKKLPTISSLKQEYAALLAEKKKLYSGYRELKDTSRALTMAKGNADRILGITPQTNEHDTLPKKENRNITHDR